MAFKQFNRQTLLEHAPDFISRLLEKPAVREPKEDEISLSVFRRSLPQIIDALNSDIRAERYVPAPASLRVAELDKQRVLVKFPIIDAFVLSTLGTWIQSALETVLTPAVYGFRRGRGDKDALRLASDFVGARGPLWVVRRDVSNFGESLDHRRIHDLAQSHFRDCRSVPYLIEQFTRFRIATAQSELYNFRGLPTGSNLQLQMENLYLHELDEEISKISDELYVRVGDDILFASSDAEQAGKIAGLIDQFLSRVGLRLNSEKSFNVLLTKPHLLASRVPVGWRTAAAFRFLGMDLFWNGTIRLPTEKWQTVLETIRIAVRNTNVIQDSRERFSATVSGIQKLLTDPTANPKFHGYLRKIISVEQLRELDRWIAVTLGKEHFNTPFSKQGLRYSAQNKLRSLGLPSCLHLARVRGTIK